MRSLYLVIFLFGLTVANQKPNIYSSNAAFEQKLYETLAKKNDGNLVFSPISLHAVLSLLSQGAEKGTLDELNRVLNIDHEFARDAYRNVLNDINHLDGINLKMANNVFVKKSYTLKGLFKRFATENYYAGVESVDFDEPAKAARTINEWVESKTNNEIKDLIKGEDIDESTRLVLTNAIYFKGLWSRQFKTDNTKKGRFYSTTGDSIEVDMMHQEAPFGYRKVNELNATVVELPYVNEDLSFIIILPNERDGIKDLEEKLKTYNLNRIYNYMMPENVKIWLPKFKIETTIDLNEPLKEMGLKKIFGSADFGGLLESKELLQVSKTVQKAFVEVDEAGARAGAATASVSVHRSAREMMNVDFRVDRPFFFSIIYRHQGNYLTLFEGKVTSL